MLPVVKMLGNFIVLCAQSQTKIFFEMLAKQAFQKVSCGSLDRQLR
jgi:hypothetical protein